MCVLLRLTFVRQGDTITGNPMEGVISVKTIKQLLRQPLKTLLGILLMTLAVAVLCICLGQALAARSTRQELDERFSTVAIPSLSGEEESTAAGDWESWLEQVERSAQRVLVDGEELSWLESLIQQRPDMVQAVSRSGLLSASIPELVPYNTLSESVFDNLDPEEAYYDRYITSTYSTDGTHFDSAVLVITLEKIGTTLAAVPPALTMEEFQASISSIINMDDRYKNDYRAYCEMNPNEKVSYEEYMYRKYLDAYEALAANYGGTETDSGTGYSVELTGTVTQVLALADGVPDPLGTTARLTLTLPSEADVEALGLQEGSSYIVYGQDYYNKHQALKKYMGKNSYVLDQPFDAGLLSKVSAKNHWIYVVKNKRLVTALYDGVPVDPWQYHALNTITMTLTVPQCLSTWDGTGDASRYAAPTIAPVTGTVEEFLASPEGAQWKAAIETAEANNHGFAVVGVEKLFHLPAFSLEFAKIGAGRDFTQEERESGARVCIIHEWVAEQSGLQIGDTITLNFFIGDENNPYDTQDAVLRPAADLYVAGTTAFTETAEYTIVGFWQGLVWPTSTDYYCFSANTVFVPRTAVQTPMEQSESVAFTAGVLKNGTMEEFYQLCRRSGHAGAFKLTDQGYGEIAGSFHNYEELARQVVTIGVVVYGILLLLYLLLYPMSMGKNAKIMESMGCHFLRRWGHILLSSLVILTAASLLGMLLGYGLWDRMLSALQTEAESTVALELAPGMLAVVAAVQLLLALALSGIAAGFTALSRGISKRR